MIKAYIENEYGKFYGFDFYPNKYWSGKDLNYCLDPNTVRRLRDANAITLQTQLGKIPQNKSVYVFPNAPCATADIRAHYQLKRDPDSGDYNVYVKPEFRTLNYCTHHSNYICFPQRKLIICYVNSKMAGTELYQYVTRFVPEITKAEVESTDPAVSFTGYAGFCFPNDPKGIYIKTLLGQFKKPLVDISQLDITNANPLDLNVLQLVYHTTKDWRKGTTLENVVLQLSMLNQYDWRNYPGTMFVLRSIICPTDAIREIMRRSSQYSKTVKCILKQTECDFVSEADFQLAQNFIRQLMGLENVKFVQFSALRNKLYDINLASDIFEMLFGTVTRVVPKEFKENSEDEK